MKYRFHLIILMILALGITSCKKDTLDAPQATLKGRLLYNGTPINVEYEKVSIELYQTGFGKTGAIRGTVSQDGGYSFLLFNGDYQMIIPNARGPFRWNQTTGNRDTLAVKVSGDQTLDLQVTPYYLVENAQASVVDTNIVANFSINKVITDANAKDIERVTLYVSKTQFVSGATNVANATISGASITDMANVSIKVKTPSLVPAQNYVFVRVGLKVANVEDLIFSPLQKLTL